ncbi:MAG: DMT family transporter [Saprospiraceae bacterium]|nr:DMT family transporter [Saprospiraceae bacterium]
MGKNGSNALFRKCVGAHRRGRGVGLFPDRARVAEAAVDPCVHLVGLFGGRSCAAGGCIDGWLGRPRVAPTEGPPYRGWLVMTDGGTAVAVILGVPVMGYVLMLGLAIGPQLLGHTAFNWALRYLSATFVAVAILGEPIGSALLAFILFNEGFERLQFVGFLLLLVGITVAAWSET